MAVTIARSIAPPSAPQRRSARQALAPALALLILTCIAYWPAMSAGFIWDDDVYVTENQTLRSVDGLKRIWFELGAVPQYYPLVHTTFWIEYRLWGLNATGYHIVNILLHGSAALLLWISLRRVGFITSIAWIAAAVFALHPVHVESVAWITERKNVLSLAFYLGALLAYTNFNEGRARRDATTNQWRWYALALGLFLCALLSKTVTCSLPAAILLLIWWQHGRVSRRDVAATLPMFVIGLMFAILTAWMEREVVGAKGGEWNLAIGDRIVLAGRAVWFYAGSLVWPANLSFVYPRWEIDARAAWQWLYPVAAAAMLVVLWLTRRGIGRGPLVAALFFGGTLLPALGFFDVYPFRFSFVADHFQYHASIGLIVLAVTAVNSLLQRVGAKPSPKAGLRHAATALLWTSVLCVLGVLTWRQTRIYKDQETLWTDTISKNPDSFLAHGNLAAVLLERGDNEHAMRHYRRALEIKNDLAEPHNALGVDAASRGDLASAIAHFRAAIDAEPQFAVAYNGLGAALARQGKMDEAIEHFRIALNLLPDDADTRMNLGLALYHKGMMTEAAEHLRRAVNLAPNDAKPHFLLGSFLSAQGEDESALGHFRRAIEINPRNPDAIHALGLSLMRLGRRGEAANQFREVLRLAPAHAEAQRNLDLLQQQESR
jgi:tetratricopeptide (TPR) repeat protein